MKVLAIRPGSPAAIAVICLIVLGLGVSLAFGTRSVFGQSEPPQITFTEAAVEGAPLPFTPEQCQLASLMLEASYPGLRTTMSDNADALRDFDAEYTKSHDWIASGCPPHPRLGFYPDGTGEGGTWRIMESQVFGMTSMTWEAPTEAPSP